MTARTAVLERANQEPNQTSPLRSRRPDASAADSKIKVTLVDGRYLVFTGLAPHHFVQNGDMSNTKPAATRTALKRKRSSFTAASPNGSNDPSDPSQDMSRSDSDNGSLFARNNSQKTAATNLQDAAPRKRRRRGQKILEESQALLQSPAPPLPFIPEDEDRLEDIDLPMPFLSRTPSPDPNDPNDKASHIYHATYLPLPKLDSFITALTKFNPAQRRTDNLYRLAANTARALRAWQDEYLEIDRMTAPHAPIARKPATGNRQPLPSLLFEDQKEADIYDYIYDPKKPGHQNPLQQRVIRDASGRELRHRGASRRTGADSALVNAAGGMSEDEAGRASRHRKPVSKYDGVADSPRRRTRPDDTNGDLSPERPTIARRGRGGGRGRGGRGRGRGGRGGVAISRRIRDLREASVGTATPSASGDDDAVSEVDDLDDLASVASDANFGSNAAGDDDDYGSAKRKGRPKGSKNLHVRSDKGVPKGPRAPRPAEEIAPVDPATLAGPKAKGTKAPKSEKRSESMTAWWAKRKAAAAEAKRKEAEAAAAAAPEVTPGDKSNAAAQQQQQPQRIQAHPPAPPPPQIPAYSAPPPHAPQYAAQGYPPQPGPPLTYPPQQPPQFQPSRQASYYAPPPPAAHHPSQMGHSHPQSREKLPSMYMYDRDPYAEYPPPQLQHQHPPTQPGHHPLGRPLGAPYGAPGPLPPAQGPGPRQPGLGPPPGQGETHGRWGWPYDRDWERGR